MSVYARRLKLTKTDAFELDVSSWLASESIATLAVTNPDGRVTVTSSTHSNGVLSCLLTGVSLGVAEVHFEYTTATRSDCYVARVVVTDDC